MTVYLLCKELYKNDLLRRGAEIAGGRWNSKGIAVLYTGDSRALCTTEIAVHTPLGILPNDYYLISIKIPEQIAIKELNPLDYPKNWRAIPFNNTTQEIGDKFVKENKYLLLKVPSVVVSGDFNYLINPLHKDFKKVAIQKIERFVFDKRFFK